MEHPRNGGGGRHELNLASRKAEEAALRRFQATHWLECIMGPLGISSEPSEEEFISCLRNGLILCNLINKIQPGSVPKVVEKQSSFHSQLWDSQPLPAYQYFENVRNFLVAVEELKLPAFEASIFERDNVEEGSSTKVVDCLLALKAYQEWKQMSGNNGFFKPPRSPFLVHSSCRPNSRPQVAAKTDSCRQLDMSLDSHKKPPTVLENQKLQELMAKALADYMVNSKENMDYDLFPSFHNGENDPVKLFKETLSTCLEEKLQKMFPQLKQENLSSDDQSSSTEDALSTEDSLSIPLLNFSNGEDGKLKPENLSSDDQSSSTEYALSTEDALSIPLPKFSNSEDRKWCRACLRNGSCNHWNLVKMQEKEILSLKTLLSTTKEDFKQLQTQLQNDLKLVGGQVQQMSYASQRYHKVVQENRNLYNMVQDLKGNIRVYCRIRPLFRAEAKSAIDFIGEDGSLVIVDPLKPQKDGRRVFEFNRVFGPNATQEDVFADTRPLIRSVMDGYNVCIFAYGQTGSGKTHTMCGPSGCKTDGLGINYLAIDDLFQLSAERKDIMNYSMHVQMVEVYNEQVHDLLAEDPSNTKLEIRSCLSDNDIALPDASMHHVRSTTDVINLMKFGEMNRAVGSTAINNRSSRSHSVLTVHVNAEDLSGNRLHSCLHLVDLAGSERTDKSEVTGEGLKEATYINKSLSSLGDVIMALAQKNSHIPYRNSKLTLLLQNALGGHAKTLMIAHVSPEGDSFGETVSTLKFAQRVSTVELGAASANKESSEVLVLKAQIESLKMALGSKDAPTPQRNNNKPREGARTPLTEKNIPRSRRLSIENCNPINGEKVIMDDIKRPKTSPTQPKSRRLSLEGPRLAKRAPEQIRLVEPVQPQGTDSNTKPENVVADFHLSNAVKSPTKQAIKSPTKLPMKSPVGKLENRTRIPRLQQPKSPEPVAAAKTTSQVGIRTVQGVPPELTLPAPANIASHGKGSQIRKSLRSIGKLINGSEKRNQHKLPEPVVFSPLNGSSNIFDEPPISSNLKAQRRQSLTSIPPPRRASLGGNPVPLPVPPTDSSEKRCPRTPPPVLSTPTSSGKRWM